MTPTSAGQKDYTYSAKLKNGTQTAGPFTCTWSVKVNGGGSGGGGSDGGNFEGGSSRGGKKSAKAEADDVAPDDISDEPIDLSEIPF